MNENPIDPQNTKSSGEDEPRKDTIPILPQHPQLATPLPGPPKSKAQRWSKEREAAELALDMPRRERDVAAIAAFPGLSDDELSGFILNNRWKFARTMKSNPHWYVVRDQSRDEAEFTRVVMHVRKFGYLEYFWGKPYTMYDHTSPDGVKAKYWSMGWSLETTVVLNRKPLSFDNKS